ncbi:MAG: glycoside hydrolase family 25 protein [Phycisphaerae bacterium]
MSRRAVNGMHLSNHRHWFVEKQIATAGETGAVTILHHLMIPRDDMADQWGDPENVYWFAKLRDGWPAQGIAPAPERLVHVRMYHSNWCELDPRAWAEHAVEVLGHIQSGGRAYDLWADPFVCVSAANEQNLHYECGDADAANQPLYQTVDHYKRIAEWNLAFWRRVDELRPDRRALACWSALAYGHEPPGTYPDAGYQIPEIREAISYCDIGASHPYAHLNWHNGWDTVSTARDGFYHLLRPFRPVGTRNITRPDAHPDPGGCLYQFPGKPWLFTEAGTFSHSDRTQTGQTQVAMQTFLAACVAAGDSAETGNPLGVTWFIGSTDDAHRENNIAANPALLDWLANLEPQYTAAAVPVAQPGGASVPMPHVPSDPIVPEPGPPIFPTEPGIPVEDDMLEIDATRRTDAVAMRILAQSERYHESDGVHVNPDSALVRAAGVNTEELFPTVPEFRVVADGVRYAAQRFERYADRLALTVFCREGEWSTLWYVVRGDEPTHDMAVPSGEGVDVSHWQGRMDWQRCALLDIGWCYIKAGEGDTWVDPQYARNWTGAKDAGLLRGAYLYYRNGVSPHAQAEHLARLLEADAGELPPALDLEDTKGTPDAWAMRQCLEHIEALTGQRPIVYTASWFWRRLGSQPWAVAYPLWVASYRDGTPVLPGDWTTYALWQYSASGAGRAYGAQSELIDMNRVGTWHV